MSVSFEETTRWVSSQICLANGKREEGEVQRDVSGVLQEAACSCERNIWNFYKVQKLNHTKGINTPLSDGEVNVASNSAAFAQEIGLFSIRKGPD